jgi:hypothetical protein
LNGSRGQVRPETGQKPKIKIIFFQYLFYAKVSILAVAQGLGDRGLPQADFIRWLVREAAPPGSGIRSWPLADTTLGFLIHDFWAGRRSSIFGSGQPRGPGKPFKNMGGTAPHIFEWFLGPPGPPRPRKSTISGRPKNHVLKVTRVNNPNFSWEAILCIWGLIFGQVFFWRPGAPY